MQGTRSDEIDKGRASKERSIKGKYIYALSSPISHNDEQNEMQILLDHMDDFVDCIAKWACLCAKHRGGTSINKEDVLIPLKHVWDIEIPGYAMSRLEQPNIKDSKYKTAVEESKKLHGEM